MIQKKSTIPVAGTNQRHPDKIKAMLEAIASEDDMSQASTVATLITLEYGRRHPPVELAQGVERLTRRVAQLETALQSAREAERFWEKSLRESENKFGELWNYYLLATGQHDAGAEWWQMQEERGHPDWMVGYLPK